MAGTKEGGRKSAATNKERNGADFYKRIGKVGGHNGHTGGFAYKGVYSDGLTGRERASKWGKIGGKVGGKKSKRGKAKHDEE